MHTDVSDEIDELGSTISVIFIETLDELDSLIGSQRRHNRLPTPEDVRDLFEQEVRQQARNRRVMNRARDACTRTVDNAQSTVADEGVDNTYRATHGQLADEYAEEITRDMTSLGNEIGDELSRTVRLVARDDKDSDAIVDRIRNKYSDDALEKRGTLIAQMLLRRCVNEAKLGFYRASDVSEVGVDSRCLDSTSRITAAIAGCDGEQVVASLDSEQSLGEQFQSSVSVEPTQDFDPLPDVPPFAYGSKAELVPIDQ